MGDPGKTVAKQIAKFHNLELIFKFNSVSFQIFSPCISQQNYGFLCWPLHLYHSLFPTHTHRKILLLCYFPTQPLVPQKHSPINQQH